MTVQEAIDKLVVDATKETDDAASLLVLIASLKQAVLDAGNLNPAQTAAVTGVFDKFAANDQAIADALAANVPPSTP